MRLSEKARALASIAALMFTAAAAAKAPRHSAAPQSAPAPSTAPAPDATGAAPAPSASATAAPPAGESAAPSTPPASSAPSEEPVPSDKTEAAGAPETEASPSNAPSASPSSASQPPKPSPHVKEPARSEVEPEEVIPPARDTLGGHFDVGVNAAMLVPFGNLVGAVPQSRTMGIGWSVGGDVGFGISRTVMLGAYFDAGFPDAQGIATGQSVTTISAGPLLRYHLVQGMAFDPWVSGGLGFRYTKDGDVSFTGVDWCRLAMGGDWYPAPNFGFGPFVALSLGTFFGQSPGSVGSAGLNAHFLLGGRIVFDTPGH